MLAGRFRIDKKSGRVTYIERLDDEQVMEQVFSAEQSKAKQDDQLSIVLAERASYNISSSIVVDIWYWKMAFSISANRAVRSLG